jgi:hypothetical protein
MLEDTVSLNETDLLVNAINKLVVEFYEMGFDREVIGAALSGIGLGLVQMHAGHTEAMRVVGSLESLIVKEDRGLQ